MSVRAIDSLINSHFLDQNQEGTTSYLFKDLKHRKKIEDVDELLNQLNQNDIGACVISIMEEKYASWVSKAHIRYPRKILPAMIVDPRKNLKEIQKVVHYYETYGVRCLRIPPFRYMLPPTDRVYWPFYVKACELNIAVSMNAGMPGPQNPGWVQNPIYYDEVAFHFPELRIIMSHCGQPWIEEAISTLMHWENIFMTCCAVAPKYWSEQFIHFINTRGKDKMMFGTEYPTITWGRARAELTSLNLRENVQPLFFNENAKRAYNWDADVS